MAAAANLPVTELAERSHVSKPTSVRFAAAWVMTA
jgi:DNA-binding MurR/RpiR family transcriptional regulator